MANKAHVVLEGIELHRRHDQEVKMQFPNAKVYTEAEAGKTIYTESITHCAAIATFDRVTRARTLCHAGGSEFTDEYFIRLAGKINPQTTLIVIWGTDWSPGAFADMNRDRWQQSLVNFMGQISKDTDQLDWEEMWSPDPKLFTWLLPATFAMRPNGDYGSLQKE